MLVQYGLTTDNTRSISGAREIEYLGSRAFWIARNASSAGFQHTEVTHAPLRRVAAHQHHAIARLDTFARQKACHTRRQLANVGVRVLLLAAVALDAHRHSRRMSLR